MFRVKAKQCSTCIYFPKTAMDIEKLEADVADPYMEGYFEGWRECHEPKRKSGACCKGFWDRHKDQFTAGQVAQRLGLVEFVEE